MIAIAGFAVIGLGWWGASGTKYVYQEIPYVISGGIFGVALVIVGAALFARYSAARLLRFWLARLVADQQIQTDRVVDAITALAEAVKAQAVAAEEASLTTPPGRARGECGCDLVSVRALGHVAPTSAGTGMLTPAPTHARGAARPS